MNSTLKLHRIMEAHIQVVRTRIEGGVPFTYEDVKRWIGRTGTHARDAAGIIEELRERGVPIVVYQRGKYVGRDETTQNTQMGRSSGSSKTTYGTIFRVDETQIDGLIKPYAKTMRRCWKIIKALRARKKASQ